MPVADSSLDPEAITHCRALLAGPVKRESVWPALVAATALAMSSLTFAIVMVLAPPVQTEHVSKGAPE